MGIRPELRSSIKRNEEVSFNDVMRIIEGKCSTINITVLEEIVEHYSIEEAKVHILAYKMKVEGFCSLKNVLRICNNAELMILYSSRLTYDTIIFTINWNIDSRTLYDVRGVLTKAFSSIANRIEVVTIREVGGGWSPITDKVNALASSYSNDIIL